MQPPARKKALRGLDGTRPLGLWAGRVPPSPAHSACRAPDRAINKSRYSIVSQSLPNFITEAQMQSLASLPDRRTTKGLRDRALIGLLCATGLRASEACALQLR